MTAVDHVFVAGCAMGAIVGCLAGVLFVRISDFLALRSAVRRWESLS